MLSAALVVSSAQAQGRWGLPAGSYQESCRDIVILEDGTYGTKLEATCDQSNGREIRSALPLPCNADIANIEGRLVCEERRGGYGRLYPPMQPRAQRLPEGSYQKSCRDIVIQDDRSYGPRLEATCGKSNGGQQRSSLPLPCNGGIANMDGRLVCEGQGAYRDNRYPSARQGPRLPEGSYQQSCKDIEIRNGPYGPELEATCGKSNGQQQRSSLRLPCRGGVGNIEGNLVCEGGR
ncbi:CVNH domain-containing protein [Paraherbaspirillum soli]|uniref:CVNH domain-containing protein n=1 Tax=Paraherbaspirillum soli TaxID=631222 RepID=A0ABW0M3T7_9BURK